MKKRKKIISIAGVVFLILTGIFISLCITGAVAHATGILDDVVSPENLFSKYSLENYQLDFYVDNSWGWLPWNWKSGIGKQVMYGVYLITNVIWTFGLYISNATGYVIQQAYQLDFINDMADKLGTSMQTLIGITPHGVTKSGIFYRTLPLIILVCGGYMAYTGLIKREVSKAVQTLLNMVAVFALAVVFVAGAPGYIKMVNGLSSDISTEVLDAGGKIMLSGNVPQEGDSVEQMRNNLFSIQVLQPWLLLQYGTTDIEKIGKERVESLLSRDPYAVSKDVGEEQTREYIVKDEIENKDNANLSTPKVGWRFGMVLFLFIMNIGISIFVFLLTGMMLLAQMLFIIFSMFLGFSFLLSMLPGQSGKWRLAAVKTFNTVLTRAGITLVTTVAFCLSGLVYSMSSEYPFFLVAFLQIVVFAGTFYKLPDIMGMFALQSNDSQNLGRRIFHRPYRAVRRGERRVRRKIKEGRKEWKHRRIENRTAGNEGMTGGTHMTRNRADARNKEALVKKIDTAPDREGAKTGMVMDTPDKMTDRTRMYKAESIPVNARYDAYKGREDSGNETTAEQKERKEGHTRTRRTYQENMETNQKILPGSPEKKKASFSWRGMVKEKDIQVGQKTAGLSDAPEVQKTVPEMPEHKNMRPERKNREHKKQTSEGMPEQKKKLPDRKKSVAREKTQGQAHTKTSKQTTEQKQKTAMTAGGISARQRKMVSEKEIQLEQPLRINSSKENPARRDDKMPIQIDQVRNGERQKIIPSENAELPYNEIRLPQSAQEKRNIRAAGNIPVIWDRKPENTRKESVRQTTQQEKSSNQKRKEQKGTGHKNKEHT